MKKDFLFVIMLTCILPFFFLNYYKNLSIVGAHYAYVFSIIFMLLRIIVKNELLVGILIFGLFFFPIPLILNFKIKFVSYHIGLFYYFFFAVIYHRVMLYLQKNNKKCN